MKYLPQPCAEFPNDNPALHDGAVWACAWPRAQPRAVVRAVATLRWASPLQNLAPLAELPTDSSVGTPPEPWLTVCAPVRSWASVRPWCLDSAPFDAEAALYEVAPHECVEQAHEVESNEPPDALPELPEVEHVATRMELDAPLGEALPEVAAADPFVMDLWRDLESGWDSEVTPWSRAHDELSPAPVSELRLFQPPSDQAESPWNRLEPLELDLSPLPPKLRDWSEFVTHISAYLIDRGATRASFLVSPLLSGERVNLRSLRLPVRRELCALGVAEEAPHDCYPTDTFRREALAFHALIVRREATAPGALDWLVRLVFALLGGDVAEADVRIAIARLEVNGEEPRAAEHETPAPFELPARAANGG